MSDADRIRALESVKRIKRMMQESPLELVSTTAEPGAVETVKAPDALAKSVGNMPPEKKCRSDKPFQNADARKTCFHGLSPIAMPCLLQYIGA
jgi:hypothetical protein